MADLKKVKPEEEEEAAMKSAETKTVKAKSPPKSIWDCGSPLYDSHELVSVTHVIERHWMIFPFQAASLKNSSSHEMVRKSTSKENAVMNDIMETTTTSASKKSTGEEEARKKKETNASGLARFFCCFCGN